MKARGVAERDLDKRYGEKNWKALLREKHNQNWSLEDGNLHETDEMSYAVYMNSGGYK